MTKTTVLIFHPNLAGSKLNSTLANALKNLDHVTVRDLYSLYPDGRIDLVAEQAMLEATDHIILQFPMYWYSAPAFMKQWLDDVLTFGWAYGTDQPALAGKSLTALVTLGGSKSEYQPDGKAGHTVDEFLLPLRATASYLGIHYHQPLVFDSNQPAAELAAEIQSLQAPFE